MLDFPVPLALFNFLPVLLTGLAMWLLAGFVARAHPPALAMAALGGALVLAGGLCKASWKLIAALTGMDIHGLAAALFPLMAPGFLLLSVAIWAAARCLRERTPLAGWRATLSILVLVVTAIALRQWLLEIPRGWFLPLLVLASLSNLFASIQLILASSRLRLPRAAILFALNLVMVFALPPIAIAAQKTVALHWLEQGLTAFGTACLALAAFLLRQGMRRGAPSGKV